jgi:hypothetical protein
MIEVITCLTGGKDDLIEQPKFDVKYTAYLDDLKMSDTWTVKKAYDRFNSPRRNSRVPKILSHQYSNEDYTLWIDGSIELISDPHRLIEEIEDYDILVFKHTRDCLYDEARICAVAGLDDPETIIEQVKGYEDRGFAKHKGLAECGFIFRKNNERVEAFNNAWWSEHCRHSVRDQLSFMYAVDKSGVKVKFLKVPYEGDEVEAHRGDYFKIKAHKTPRNDEKN